MRLKISVVLLFLLDAQHGFVENPTVVEGPGKVGETPPGHLHCFHAAAFVFGCRFLFRHGEDGLETVSGLEMMFKSLTGGRSNSEQQA